MKTASHCCAASPWRLRRYVRRLVQWSPWCLVWLVAR